MLLRQHNQIAQAGQWEQTDGVGISSGAITSSFSNGMVLKIFPHPQKACHLKKRAFEMRASYSPTLHESADYRL
jgi:hypothetical protein